MGKAIEFEVKIKSDSGPLRTLTIEATSADAAIDRIVESAKRAGDNLKKMAENSLILDASVRTIQTLQGVVDGLVSPYNSFETAMRGANTMANTSGEAYDELKNKISDLSREIPLVREALADGLYQVVSNGVPEDNWLDFLTQSSKSAVGGMAGLGQTVTVTSTLIKNYGEEWSSAGAIQDKIQMTAKNGVTTFDQLGQVLPRVSGSAAQLGMQMDELLATFATATGVTGNTAEVSTQLAAVLNSLIKPSSEASKAADAMGIRFDAASIKACGGFQNFLTQLASSVKEYAASSGQLSETIYGQLFGSAEALRLLGSLTGEQKDKFAENIAAMSDSAGTIDAAYSEMSSTGSAFAQIVQSNTRAAFDWAGALLSTSAPILQIFANLGVTMLSLMQLSSFISKVVTSIRGWNVVTHAAAAGQAVLTGAIKLGTVTMHAAAAGQATLTGAVKTWNIATLAAASKQAIVTSATKAWTVAQTALNLILSLNPIGIVIMAIAALVAIIITAYRNSETFRKICDQLWVVVKRLAQAVWDWLVKAFETVSVVVKKAWEWVKRFFGISDEDDVRKVADTLDAQAEATEHVADANEKAVASGLKVAEAVNWQAMSYERLGAAIETQKAKVASLAGVDAKRAASEAAILKEMEARYKALGQRYGLASNNTFDGKTLIANARSYKELGNNITYYQNQLQKTDPAEQAEIRRLSELIAQLSKTQDAIKQLQAAYSQPAELSTLADIDNAIEYQQGLRFRATADQIAGIDAEIRRLNAVKTALEDAGHVAVGVDQIETYQQLTDELAWYEDKLKRVSVDGRPAIQAHIKDLERLKAQWDAAMEQPEAVDKIKTINDCEKALSWYEARMKSAGSAETAEIAAQMVAIRAKRDLLERPVNIATMAAEAVQLGDLSGLELKIQLEAIGVDEIKDRILELQRMLADTRNPLDDAARGQVQNLLATWRDYEAQLQRSQLSVGNVWGDIKGLHGSVESLTNAIRGNGSAWEKISGVIDGIIGLYRNFGNIVNLIRLLTNASHSHSAAKIAEAGATGMATAATTTSAAASVSAASAEAAASNLVTTAKVQEAAAKTMAAHAGIPWVGIAIAGGLVGAMVATMMALPKFADGGIAYGPTLGIFGEYAGASTNPEVVAPLNRLKELIGRPDDGNGSGVITRVEIDGRKLVMLIEREIKLKNRS